MSNLTVAEIAKVLGGEVLCGDGTRPLHSVRPLDHAEANSLSFVSKSKYLQYLSTTEAAAVLLTAEMFEKAKDSIQNGICVIALDNPYVAFARAAQIFAPPIPQPENVHESSVISPSAKVHSSAMIGPFVVIGADAVVGEDAILHAGAHVESGAKVGAHSILYNHVVLRHGCEIGKHCILHPGVIIGSDGFGFAQDTHGSPADLQKLEHVKIPQVGNVIIEDRVEIGANSCIDRGTLGATRIKSGTKIDNLVQIAHNVEIGNNCIVVAQAGIAGSTKLKTAVTIAAQAGIGGHIEIGEAAVVWGQAGVPQSVEAGEKVMGTPAQPLSAFLRNSIHFAQLSKIVARIKRLENKFGSQE
jgi:UDP-3-O-[3-hydroxymyristoyl] glucosamine N-acyltransferase